MVAAGRARFERIRNRRKGVAAAFSIDMPILAERLLDLVTVQLGATDGSRSVNGSRALLSIQQRFLQDHSNKERDLHLRRHIVI